MPLESMTCSVHCKYRLFLNRCFAILLFFNIFHRMLAADAFYAIIEAAEGSTSKQPVYQLPEVKLVANQFHKIFLTKGGGSPMTEMFRQFRGRNPTHEALLYSLGLKKSKSFV